MLDYSVKVLLFQTLFLVVYDLFLKRETFFQWNRAYLIITSLLAYIIPLIKLEQVVETVPQEYVILLPEVMLSPSAVIEQKFDWAELLFTGLYWTFWIGLTVVTLLFLIKLNRIFQLIKNNPKENKGTYNLVTLERTKAFSFFSYIFLGKSIKNEIKEQIIAHELVHVRQKHSFDLMFFECQRIVLWFNPYSYLFQHRIAELHEFIADSKSIKASSKKDYFQNLLTQTFNTHKISFINPFFKHSLIKKRIFMLNKKRSRTLLKFKYVLLLPLLIGMMGYTSCEQSEPEIQKEASIEESIQELWLKLSDDNTTKEELKRVIELIVDKNISKEALDVDKREKIIEMLYNYTLEKRKNNNEQSSVKDYSNADEIPFSRIEIAPIFPGCEEAEDTKKCLQESIQKHVVKNFDVLIAKDLGLESGKKRVYVQFIIGKDGKIGDVKARGPHEALEAAAVRTIESLPSMHPGKKLNGKNVDVKYTLPISFLVD